MGVPVWRGAHCRLDGGRHSQGVTLSVEALPEFADRIQALLSPWSWPPFTLNSSSQGVLLSWSDGPSVSMVRSCLAPLVEEFAEEGSFSFSFDRNVTRPYLCAAIEHMFGTEGVGSELAAAAEAARLDEVANPSLDGLFVGLRELRRNGWSNAAFAGAALPVVEWIVTAFDDVDLSDGTPLDVLRPGVPGVVARVELLATLSRDAGISQPTALVLWAAAVGYPAADSLASGGQ